MHHAFFVVPNTPTRVTASYKIVLISASYKIVLISASYKIVNRVFHLVTFRREYGLLHRQLDRFRGTH